MSTNIDVIEKLLLTSNRVLNVVDIATLAKVKKKSITSAITRLSRRRSDLVRTTHEGRSYYGIGIATHKAIVAEAVNISASPTDATANTIVRDGCGRFVSADCNAKTIKAQRKCTEGKTASVKPAGKKGKRNHLKSKKRVTAAIVEVPQIYTAHDEIAVEIMPKGVETFGDVTSSFATETQSTPEQLGSPVTESSLVIEEEELQRSLDERRKELDRDLRALELQANSYHARIRTKVASLDAEPNDGKTASKPKKVSSTNNTDLFRGWFNPSTGIKPEKLGIA